MASVINQLVFHPSVSRSLKLGSTTLGRDKLYRAVQYFARFYAWYLLSRGDKDAAVRWAALKAHLATARKLMRLGKPLEHLQAAFRVSLKSGQPTEQITTIARQISYCGYLSFDAFVWANSVKFLSFSPETAQKISKIANRFWLAGIIFSLVHGSAKVARLSRESKRLSSTEEKGLGDASDRSTHFDSLQRTHAAARHQLLIDSLDIWLPASALGYTGMNEGVLGIFGLITSVMALEKQWGGLA